ALRAHLEAEELLRRRDVARRRRQLRPCGWGAWAARQGGAAAGRHQTRGQQPCESDECSYQVGCCSSLTHPTTFRSAATGGPGRRPRRWVGGAPDRSERLVTVGSANGYVFIRLVKHSLKSAAIRRP